MLAESVEVNIEGIVSLGDGLQKKSSVEIIALSTGGAVIRAETLPQIGAPLVLQLQNESNVKIEARVHEHVDAKNKKKLVALAFDSQPETVTKAIKAIVDYFSRLKRAGVQFGGS
ncbi:hypothetical protein EBR78_01635 [bacterium]|nr:hypothetical protein [bacterium]